MTGMRRLPVLLSLALLAAVPSVAPAQAAPAKEKATTHGYVVNRLAIPMTGAQATKVGFDLDGDGDVDNKVGNLFALLAGQGVNLQAASDDAVQGGTLVTLLSVQASSLVNATGVQVRLFKGKTTASPDLDGGGTFTVDSSASVTKAKGAIVKKKLTTKPGKAKLSLPSLYPGLPAIKLVLTKARLTAKCTAVRCAKGRVGGGISTAQVDTAIIPAIGAIARAAIKADCTGTTESTCADGSNGKTMMGLFDTNNDGLVTDQEVRSNPYVKGALAPDVDLNGDGKTDALSMAVGFSAVNATIKGA